MLHAPHTLPAVTSFSAAGPPRTTATAALFHVFSKKRTVPESPIKSLVQALQLPMPGVVLESLGWPVLIHAWKPEGGPEPESSLVCPRLVSYFRLEGS